MLRTLFKIGRWATLTIFLTLSIAFIAIWMFPGFVINTAVLKRAMPYMPKSIEVHWKDIDLSAKSLSFFRKQVHLRGTDICYRYAAVNLDSCFSSADLTAEIDIKGLLPKYRVGPVSLLGGTFRLALPYGPEEKKEETKSGGLLPSPPEFLKKVALDSVKIELKKFAYISQGLHIAGAATLSAVGKNQKSNWDLTAEADITNGKDRYRSDADVHLQSLHSDWFGPYVGTGAVNATLPGNKKVAVDFRGTPLNADQIAYRLGAAYKERRKEVTLAINGKGGLLGVSGSLSGKAKGVAEHIAEISLKSCPFSYLRKNDKADIAQAMIDCSIVIATNFPNKTNTVYNTYLRTLSLKLKANADVPVEESKKEMKGKVELVMDPLLAKVKHGEGSLATNFHGRLDEFPKHLDLDTRLLIDIPQFQKVVQMLNGFPWAVPDPFRTLDGELKLEVTSKGKVGDEVQLPVKLTSRLKSKEQNFILDGDGALKFTSLANNPQTHFDFKLMLSDIKLVLPYLSLSAPPRFIPDPRIRVPEKRSKQARAVASTKKSSFTYDIQVQTPPGMPLRLVSNLAKSEVPLTIDIRSNNDNPATGSVRIANFNVEMFRRNATVQHFYLRLTPEPENMEVNGEVRVTYTDYTVKILILGLAKAPEIKFVSEPPLPEKDVIAVLLFGKKIEALDADQTQSVGSTNTAIADSAVSLASMYLLAATPVESVGYDPGSGVFNAKVRLADGTSLTIGSNFSSANQVGLRRRLGSNLYINTTYISDAAQTAKNKLQTLLEWSKGY